MASSPPTTTVGQSQASRPRTGVIGLGWMGRRIAESLIAAGHDVVGFDVNPAVCAQMKDFGVAMAASPAAVAAACRTTVSCVTGVKEVQAVALGPDGLARGQAKGDVFIDCTTVTLACALDFAAAFAKSGVHYLDAPLSRLPPTAVAFVGGTEEAVKAATPALKAIASWICHLGPNGAGARGKLLSQYATFSAFAAGAHALREALRHGLDIRAFATGLRNGSASSMIIEGAIAGVLNDSERDWGRISTIQKDFSYVRELGEGDANFSLPLLPAVEDFFLDVPADQVGKPLSYLVTKTEKTRGN